jgi:hypothetical protein
MKKYDASLRIVTYCRVSVYADNEYEAEGKAISKAEIGEVTTCDKEIVLTDVYEIPYLQKDRIKQKIIQSFLEDQYDEEAAREFFEEAFKRGLINRRPK